MISLVLPVTHCYTLLQTVDKLGICLLHTVKNCLKVEMYVCTNTLNVIAQVGSLVEDKLNILELPSIKLRVFTPGVAHI